jgi:pimeloyl-ACP methyl ester carboxylesterase
MIISLDGIDVFAATGGLEADRNRAPAMILVHGAGMDSSVWQQQTRYLAHRFRQAGLGPVLAIDLPGHGRSGGDALESIEAMATWLGRLIEQLAAVGDRDDTAAGPCLVGHSMGTFVVLELAAQSPELAGSLVLLGSAAAMPVHPDLLDAAANELRLASSLMAGWSHAKPGQLGPNPAPGMVLVDGARALVDRSRPDALATDLAACAAYDGAVAAARRVACPVTVVSGAADMMTPARAVLPVIDGLSDQITVRHLTMPVGHMMMTEDPDAVRRVLFDAVTDPG